MAGLLAWAADVVGAHKEDEGENGDSSIPLIFTPEQQTYVQELDRKAASLSRSIQDLRLRLPPADIAQRLPHLHAHSLASNAALALQLNAHSATREQTQLRELRLQEENAAYEKAISNCENKIQERMQEANSLRSKLKEMDDIEKILAAELEHGQDTLKSQRGSQSKVQSKIADEAEEDKEDLKSCTTEKLEDKKKELSLMEEKVQELEKKWAQVQHNALKQPTPAQREKMLDKQLHSLIEQLAVKQTQAEGLVGEIHLKEMELERLNGLWRRIGSSNLEVDTTRNRFSRSSSEKGSSSAEFTVDAHQKLPYYSGGQNENQEKLMLLRSAFVLYILALHIAVFIKLSF